MATQATVQLVVDESGAVPGLTRFQQRAMAAMQAPTAQAKLLGTEINAVGTAGTVAGDKMSAGFQKSTGHALTNLDAVRLMRDDLGVHIPRAMEKLIASTQAFQAVANVAFGAFAFVGVVELLGTIGSKLDNVMHSLMGDTKAVQDLRKALEEANEQEIINPKNVGTATQSLAMLNAEIEKYQNLQSNGGADYLKRKGIDVDGIIARDEEMRDKLLKADAELGDKQKAQNISQQRENAAIGLEAYRKIAQDTATAKAEIDDKVNGTNGQAKTLTPDQGAAAKKNVDQKAAREYLQLNEEINKQIIQMHNAAVDAGLESDARLNAEKQQSLDALLAEYKRGELTKRQLEQETADVSLKFDNEKMLREKKMMDEAQKALRDAQSVGLTGLAKIRAERNAHNADVDAMEITPQAKAVRHQAVNTEANQQEGTWWQQNDEDEGGRMKAEDDQRARNAAQDMEYEKRAADAERRIKADSLNGWVSDYRAAIAAIATQRQEQLTKIQSDATTEKLTDAEVAQRKVDIERSADAQIAEEHQQMAHQISQTLEEAYTNPISFIKSRMQKMMFDILANAIEQSKMFQGIFGQNMSGAGAHAGILGQALGIGPHPTFAGSPGAGGGGYSGGGYSPMTSTGSTGSDGYRPDYAGGGSGGSGGGIGSTISSTVGSARGIYSQISSTAGIPGASDDPYQTVGDDQGNVTLTGNIPGGASGGSAAGAASTAMGIAGAGMAGYQGYQDTMTDFKSGSAGGTLKGMMGDAAAGAMIGSLFGPEGTLIGAGVGAAVGAASGIAGMIMGEGGRLAARDYYEKSLFPEIERMRTSNGSSDYQSAISDINTTASKGMSYMSGKWGPSSAQWVDENYLRKEQLLAVGQITARARGGSYATTMSAAQFHSGGDITGFGDLATSGNEGFIHAMLGEAVVNPVANATHGPAVKAMNDGASPSDIAQMYGGGSGSGGGGDTNHHYHISAIDPKSFDSFLRNGGARTMTKALNQQATRYAGDGISG